MAVSGATKEAIHVRRFVAETQRNTKTVTVNNSNTSEQKLLSNPIFHSRTKHIIDVKYHCVRGVAGNKEIEVGYMPTGDLPADI